MKPKNSELEKAVFYFEDKDLYRLDLDTLNRLWPIIDKETFSKSNSTYLSLPELHQLELALILIRRAYMRLSMDEKSERLSIVLEVLGESMRIEPVSCEFSK